MWFEIVSMSPKEVVKKKLNEKEIVIHRIFTLEYLDNYLKYQDISVFNIDEKDLYNLIHLFHRVYNSIILSG